MSHPEYVLQHKKAKKHWRKFVIKGNKSFLCDIHLDYETCKDLQNYGFGYEMYDLCEAVPK